MKTNVYYYTFETAFGKMFIASTNKGVCIANFVDENYETQLSWLNKYFHEDNIYKDKDKNINAYNQLQEYFKGDRKFFDLTLDILGTTFQKQVWSLLEEIPYGELLTYKDMAIKLGDSKKSRAVGGAVGKNPIIIIVPCHRVIGSNGKMTGFSSVGGIELKKNLLKLEKSI
ncbi:methylated-DNA--[protein]-cysteine S-methyltransferase [Tepidibacter aestuarii]|uniref:methylated-DNA--[protein]-cysteine S-methyltransferase n=1 Tax=Tepidibacter aestuarii TaxID=2925782 RepID=UPI0020C045E4|nr:methylated-DNA--[protein]-cysteine S-methyltransferase [Tepidibacter aestuarii]CAH2212117.1 Methylated-DNA--protein-cysteine methyltransferase [Tepidibacter aestuarii]